MLFCCKFDPDYVVLYGMMTPLKPTYESGDLSMSSKQRSTYFTPEKVSAVRRNVQNYDWGKQKLVETQAQADLYLDLGWEWLWNLPTPQTIPRSYAVNQKLGCPVCGVAHHSYGRWPWLADTLDQPWKLTCPSCQSVFPSNDFAAYYESAKDEHGVFQRGQGDPKYLKNELYPERGDSWGVDDGYGWIDNNGENWTFIAFYNHWKIWIRMIDASGNRFPAAKHPWAHGGMVETVMLHLRDAYVYTGELRYAQAGIVLLDRIADLYPEMDTSVYKWEDGFLHSHGSTGQGGIVGSIWETSIVQSFVSAYDAFYPAMLGNSEVQLFLADKALEFKLANAKTSMDLIRVNIEDQILRQVYKSVRTIQIRGNHGSHQCALTLAAIVLDEPGTTEEWLDFVFQDGKVIPPEAGGWSSTGGNMLYALMSSVDRDGFGDEAAPSYNNIWVTAYKQVADILFGYDRYTHGDLYQNAKFRQMLRAHAGLIMIDRYMPQIGDSDSVGNPSLLYKLGEVIELFEKTGETVYAQLAVLLSERSKEQLRGGLFSPDP
ncbi:MAG: bacterial Ig-like protein, partial [Paenibacillus sp.]|nr:bacterial Ig-like protein [Paenibacillus sp.]